MKNKKLATAGLFSAVAIMSATAVHAVPGSSTGPSSSQTPYLVRTKPGIVTTSILTVGDNVDGYEMAGIPDGLGAFDNGDGTFTVLMNHELRNTAGVEPRPRRGGRLRVEVGHRQGDARGPVRRRSHQRPGVDERYRGDQPTLLGRPG